MGAESVAIVNDTCIQLYPRYSALSREAFDRDVNVWKQAPKFRVLFHLCEWTIPGTSGWNPRTYWTYTNEDLAGSLVDVATNRAGAKGIKKGDAALTYHLL